MSTARLEVPPAARKRLRDAVRGDLWFDDVTRGLYATDASIYQITPACVICPRDEDDVLAVTAIASEYEMPILPRGAGTSLGGQAVGPGMVLDFSRYMTELIDLDVDRRRARVRPGIVLDKLNARLAGHGLHFAPDPATGNRATIGGMIGNNASGTRSIVYGITRDHVTAARAVLADGTAMDFGALSAAEYTRRCNERTDGPEARLLAGFRQIIDANRDEIVRRFPKVMRRVQGYNLDRFGAYDWNLTDLIVGSEGTLATVVEAELNLERLPRHKALCVVHFEQLPEAIRAVKPIVEYGPSAVELLDSDVIAMARRNLRTAPMCKFVQGEPAGALIVEFFADEASQAKAKAEHLGKELRARKIGYAWPVLSDPADQACAWAVRKSGLGLLLALPGERKPVACIEDCCVPLEVLAEYIGQIRTFCDDRGVPVVVYAHASVGTFHVRPMLNLKVQWDIDLMKAISEKAFELVTAYGGAWSGEHGDGRTRSPFLPRFFGPQIYEALRQVKRLFDPAGLMNPGVIVDSAAMDANLRYGPHYRMPEVTTAFHYRRFGSLAAAVEQCGGQAACHQTLDGAMCPTYRLTRREADSPRGRANALRLAITGQLGTEALTNAGVAKVMELCLACKACKSECPSNVDIARLKSEYLQRRRDAVGTSGRTRWLAGTARRSELLAGRWAPLLNWLQDRKLIRKAFQRLIGIDSRRSMPRYARRPLREWFDLRSVQGGELRPKVVLFDDTYMNYNEPRVGIAAVELLESCGYEVILARAGSCQRIRIAHGYLREAKCDGEKTLRNLDAYIGRRLPIVVCEPSCASALVDDLPDLIDDEALGQRIGANVLMIDEFLARELECGHLDCEFTSPFESVLIHVHCHRHSLFDATHMIELLHRVPGMTVEQIDPGCCGMTDSFGYGKEHYDQSMAIGEQTVFPAIRNRADGTAVVACGSTCRRQIADGTGVRALHWVQTLRGIPRGG